MKLSDMVKIDNRFEKSINLLLDLEDPEKINFYIPTRSSIKILKEYLEEIRTYTGNRATLLIGPYGKGKSHLLLVLLNLISKFNMPQLEDLIERIAEISPETAKLIKDIRNEHRPLLPVIINTSNDDLNHVFLRSLNQALKREGLSDIAPDNYFSEILKVIQQWKESFPDTYCSFIDYLNKSGYSLTAFTHAVENFDDATLQWFRNIYPELTSGSTFNPIFDGELIQVYQSVNRKLCEKYAYKGIYIIFDEFSKYIEGHDLQGFANDMKVLQDICELCNSAKEEQVHLTCVAHKGIRAYGNTLSREIQNTFRGVEGRLKEVLFVVSSQNNYELVADAIQKKDLFYKWADSDEKYGTIINESYKVPGFSSLFVESDFKKIVGQGCYPLTPIAAMLLLSLSEKVAQNERTIFTYLTNKEPNCLAKLIQKKNVGNFIGADSLYDYFEAQIRSDVQTRIHNEWLKADYALKKAEHINDRIIIKCLSVMRLVNKPEEIPANHRFLWLSSGLHRVEFSEAIERLIADELIVYKAKYQIYDFKNNVGIDVERAIADCEAQRFMRVNVCSLLNENIKCKYIFPKKYNQSFRMTRYFEFRFISDEEFMNLSTSEYLYEDAFSDGKVLLIVPQNGESKENLAKHLEEIHDKRLLAYIPEKLDDIAKKIRHLQAVKYLKGDKNFIENNKVLFTELQNTESDDISDINEWIGSTYFRLNEIYYNGKRLQIGTHGLNRLISDICENIYCEAPVINNELINRNEVSTQILKARNVILEMILSGDSFEKFLNGTSAEATIYRATVLNTKNDLRVQKVREVIDSFILKCDGQKYSFKTLFETLMQSPMGLRRGVIPIYLAERLLELEDMPIIYLNNQEVILDVNILNNITKEPEKYYLYIERESSQKNEYIRRIEELFAAYSIREQRIEKRNRLTKITLSMQSWFRSLPQTSVTFAVEDYEGQPIKEIKAFRKLFVDMHLNSRDIIFERIPNIFGNVDLIEVIERVTEIKKELDMHIHYQKKMAIQILREEFRFEENADLKQSFLTWYDKQPELAKNSLFHSGTYGIMNYIRNIHTNDEEEIAGRIAKEATGTFIEDWNDEMPAIFRRSLSEAITEVKAVEKISNEGRHKLSFSFENSVSKEFYYDFDLENLSTAGTFFKNAVEDALEENETTMEPNEKIGILMSIIEKLVN